MDQMLSGAIATASLVASLFFFRFWRQTRDRFFLWFALSFWIEAANRVAWILGTTLAALGGILIAPMVARLRDAAKQGFVGDLLKRVFEH